MPYRPLKPCAHPGCAKLTAKRYCEDHARAANREYNQHRRDPASMNATELRGTKSVRRIWRRTQCVSCANLLGD